MHDGLHAILVMSVVVVGSFWWGVAGAWQWSVADKIVVALTFAGIELAYLCAATCLPRFRRRVDRVIDEQAREEAGRRHEELLSRMGAAHRLELVRLEATVDAIDETPCTSREPRQLVSDACRDLLATYARLAVAHEKSRGVLASQDEPALRAELAALEVRRATVAPTTRVHLERRLAALRERLSKPDGSRETLGVIGAQLALIADRVRLAYEEYAAPPAWAAGPDEHVRIALDSERDGELAVRVRVDTPVDPAMLQRGRPSERRTERGPMPSEGTT